MRQAYFAAMDGLHRACLVIAAIALVVITLIIPYGVFTRYVLNSASSWPEPLAVLLMILISFLSAVVCYREHLHIGVNMIPDKLSGAAKTALGIAVELIILAISLFMIWYGYKLVARTWFQGLAEFPSIPAGVSYLAVPVAGVVTTLFGIERFLKGNYFPPPPDLTEINTVASE
jgi:TRAP-type C4-dicarboxylate transport system permease small subunit